MSNVDLFSDLNRQHVLGPLKRTRVCFPRLSDHAFAVGAMWVDGQPRLDSGKHFTRLFGRGVAARSFTVGLRVHNLMNKDVNTLRRPNQVLGNARVPW
jgi:hypothetical protein